MSKLIHIGIVGHRYLKGAETNSFVAQQCLALLQQFKSRYAEVVALSAIAEGADTLFAEAALALGLPIDIVRPFEQYASDFESTCARARYESLRAAARSETRLGYPRRSDKAYLAAMKWVVERSDVLIAVWDGLPSTGVGGTGDAVEQVVFINRDWIHLDVTDLSVKSHVVRASGCSALGRR